FYFADHNGELAQQVARGRAEFMAQFPSLAGSSDLIPGPHELETFQRCKLDLTQRQTNRLFYNLHRDLLRLRREDRVFRLQKQRGLDGAVLGESAFVMRLFAADGLDRLLLVNLGRDLHLPQAPEPLLAPPSGHRWQMLWSSEDVRYGGCGTPPLET